MIALPMSQGLLAVASLALVIVLVLGAARLARFLPSVRQNATSPGVLTLRGSLALDGRRRVFLVDAGGHQALILTGGASDIMVGLPAAPPQC